ncbi:MAG TPA: hypothetical protein VJ914_33765 [Pseudonocardiaceae bacterium]|nr:hypothetical protein [Pseudonocardiaceae bacterium]
MTRTWRWVEAVGLACVLLTAATVVTTCSSAATPDPPAVATLHYAANDNFAPDGRYLPGQYGFDLADVSTPAQLAALPAGVRGLAFLGACLAPGAAFATSLGGFTRNAKLFGFYLVDDPDPATCAPSTLKAESDYIHTHFPGAKTFILEQNLAQSTNPSYVGGYNPANTGIDLYGIDPYPCRTELNGCDPNMIANFVAAAERFGIPASSIVPVFQAFGGGSWVDDGGGQYQLPTASQMNSMLAQWAQVIPSPLFDFVYSWGSQRGDRALAGAPADLLAAFAAHNRTTAAPG